MTDVRPSLLPDGSGNDAEPFSFRPHPAWRKGFAVREGIPAYVNGWRVTAVDATGAEFGFAVMTGLTPRAEAMARALAALLAQENES